MSVVTILLVIVIQLEKQCNLNEEEHEKEIEVARQLSQQQQQNLRAKFEQKVNQVLMCQFNTIISCSFILLSMILSNKDWI